MARLVRRALPALLCWVGVWGLLRLAGQAAGDVAVAERHDGVLRGEADIVEPAGGADFEDAADRTLGHGTVLDFQAAAGRDEIGDCKAFAPNDPGGQDVVVAGLESWNHDGGHSGGSRQARRRNVVWTVQSHWYPWSDLSCSTENVDTLFGERNASALRKGDEFCNYLPSGAGKPPNPVAL